MLQNITVSIFWLFLFVTTCSSHSLGDTWGWIMRVQWLNISSGRIPKSSCPVQTVSPGPVSTHTGGILTVCLNAKMTSLKLKQECRFLRNNKPETCLSNTYPVTSFPPHLRRSSMKAFHPKNVRLYILIMGMKIRSVTKFLLTTGGKCQLNGGNNKQKEFIF